MATEQSQPPPVAPPDRSVSGVYPLQIPAPHRGRGQYDRGSMLWDADLQMWVDRGGLRELRMTPDQAAEKGYRFAHSDYQRDLERQEQTP